jgi:hypothetical protein
MGICVPTYFERKLVVPVWIDVSTSPHTPYFLPFFAGHSDGEDFLLIWNVLTLGADEPTKVVTLTNFSLVGSLPPGVTVNWGAPGGLSGTQWAATVNIAKDPERPPIAEVWYDVTYEYEGLSFSVRRDAEGDHEVDPVIVITQDPIGIQSEPPWHSR